MELMKINELESNEEQIFTNDYNNKILILILFSLLIFSNINYINNNLIDKNQIRPYIKYINDCKNHKKYNRNKIINENPYISVCIPSLNMNKYIERAIISIINQSFQNFEIIVVNDNSKDETEMIIKRLQLDDNRIKLINHNTVKFF